MKLVSGLLLMVAASSSYAQWRGDPRLREVLFPRCKTYARTEFISWFAKGNKLPPLVTTSVSGTPLQDVGVLGEPGTIVVFGDERIADHGQLGGRVTFGHWFDKEGTFAIETQMWGAGIAQASDERFQPLDLIIARPFFNTETNDQDAHIVAFPGALAGNLQGLTRNEMYSVDLLGRYNVVKGPCTGYIDLIAGYRFFRLRDALEIREEVGNLQILDDFTAENSFHGVDMGAIFGIRRGPWLLDVTTKVALGNMREKSTVNGFTQLANNPASRVPGGFLAAPSNIGTFTDNEFAAIPEVDLRLVWAFYERFRLSFGINTALVSKVVRSGDQIDLTINPSQLAPLPLARGGGTPSGLAQPAPRLNDTAMWIHGLTFGAEVMW